ncbi:ABC transporter permease [Pseudomonas matsuisoli]|uniref:Iron ABC transporter permease n=1 Tax=Pseudomonas matsuisoli TaxID=1515666 RepID=A0A917UUR3_9PSED|nr:iron chelate uptake ABC transporter family permease subunit [Pseudomonas matsuisoli]GGJ86514.1 iron ABC transporter permease [Pseudomonas matsuisoli]
MDAFSSSCVAFMFSKLLITTVLLLLCLVSISLGADSFSLLDLFHSQETGHVTQLLLDSRLPRTLAVLLSGVSLSVAGLIMQMLVRNRFAEPSTTGTMESAMLGMLIVVAVAPAASPFVKMAFACLVALAGSAVFILLLTRIPLRTTFLVPLIGLILGGIIHSISIFLAYRYGLVQSLYAWSIGDFSGVLRGRYELLWLGLALTAIAYLLANQYTVAGMGREFASNLGLNYGRLAFLGLLTVSAVSAVVMVTAGNIPFLGLIVPNIVHLVMGDNIKRTMPWVAMVGGSFALFSDVMGRLIIFPFEVPIGTVMGVLGSVILLALLHLRGHRLG